VAQPHIESVIGLQGFAVGSHHLNSADVFVLRQECETVQKEKKASKEPREVAVRQK
jgi:hypothetical protein